MSATTSWVALTATAIQLVFAAGLLLFSTSTISHAAAAATGGVGGNNFPTLYDLLHNTPELSAALQLFNYTGLLALTQHPNTTITCFLPSSKYLDSGKLIEAWEGSETSYRTPGRFVWTLLLHHCLDGPRTLMLASLSAKKSFSYTYDSAFVMRGMPVFTRLIKAKVAIKKTSGSPFIIFEDERGTEANVITADLRGGKSVVHIIDNAGLLPEIPPPDVYCILSDVLQFKPLTAAILAASSLNLDNATHPFTAFLPGDNAWSSLLRTLKIDLPQLLSRPALVDLLVRAHVVNGSALFTGSLISFPGPLVLNTLAGPVNVTTDLSIFPDRRPGGAKFLTLATRFSSALMGDYDVGGNGNDHEAPQGDYDVGGNGNDYEAPQVAPWVVHYLDKVLLPASTTSLRMMLSG